MVWDGATAAQNPNLYGSHAVGVAIQQAGDKLDDMLRSSFPGAQFINEPRSFVLERDKVRAKAVLSEAGLPVAYDVEPTIDAILSEVEKGNTAYVIVQFGSLGKGITYIGPKVWTTNLAYDGTNLANHAGKLLP